MILPVFFFFHNKTALENKRKQLISHAIFYFIFFFATLLYQVVLSKDDLLTLITAVLTQTDSRVLFTELNAGKSRFCLFGSLDFPFSFNLQLVLFQCLKNMPKRNTHTQLYKFRKRHH